MLTNEFINGVQHLQRDLRLPVTSAAQLSKDYELYNEIYIDLPPYFEKTDLYKLYVLDDKGLLNRFKCYWNK